MKPHPVVVATGHVIGWTYYSPEHRMTYEVLDRATLWDLAPDAAVRVRWANGNEMVLTRPAAVDQVTATASLVA
jgi:hypothetical protein